MRRSVTTNVPTLQVIARRLGVHATTVSRALHGDARVHPDTARRILAVAKEVGYDLSMNESARRLALRRHGLDVLHRMAACAIGNGMALTRYAYHMIYGMMHRLMSDQYTLILTELEHAGFDGKTGKAPAVFARGDVDGLLAHAGSGFANMLAALRQCSGFGDKPIVTLIDPYPGCSSVVADDEDGGYQATRHLLELGHRHIMFTRSSSPLQLQVRRRIDGMARAVKEFNLDPDTHLHLFLYPAEWGLPLLQLGKIDPNATDVFCRMEMDKLAKPLMTFLMAYPQVTAYLAPNDSAAVLAWYILQREGRHIPRDFSLIGFDDIRPHLDGDGRNLLSTVHVPLYEIGCQAAQLLVELLTGTVQSIEHRMVPVQFIDRASTASPKKRG